MKDIINNLKGISYIQNGNTIKTVKKDNKQLIIRKINNSKYCYNIYVFKNDNLYMDYEALTIQEAIKTMEVYI